ncbi:MAG: hypothetical protein B7C24_06640 [Bacteroidetes bacterium 4572_77]|nr:MAG: hypothetical protein B7C24_06640 [Bacteroidetes bacterium 4572_77]
MKNIISSFLIVLISATSIMAQSSQKAVKQLLLSYQEKINLSQGEEFSEENNQAFLQLFYSSNAQVATLGIPNLGEGQTTIKKFVNGINERFDEEADIVVNLQILKQNGPNDSSPNRKLYEITALQNFSGFKKDGSDFVNHSKIQFEVEYLVNQKIARIVSIKKVESKSGLWVDAHVGAGMTSISSDYADMQSSGKFGISYGLALDYMFNEHFGITTGINFSSYSSTFELASFEQEAFRTTDQDNDEYDLHAQGSGISSDVNLKYMEIPIGIAIRYNGFISRLGIKYGIASSSSNANYTDGSITTTGYYPKYNVTLHDIPEYGFGTYSLSGKEAQVFPESAMIGFVQLGYQFFLSEKVSLSFMGFYQTSFSSVYTADSKSIATGNEEYNSVLHLNDATKISAYGLEVGIGFKLF